LRAGAFRAALHNGAGPMDRTMAGRHTPGLEYKPEPLHRTRTELLEARKKAGAVNMAYDLDGDGSVRSIAPCSRISPGCVTVVPCRSGGPH
jgi:hypothetical protein